MIPKCAYSKKEIINCKFYKTDLFSWVKDFIQDRTGIPYDNMFLYCDGRLLKDEESIIDSGIAIMANILVSVCDESTNS